MPVLSTNETTDEPLSVVRPSPRNPLPESWMAAFVFVGQPSTIPVGWTKFHQLRTPVLMCTERISLTSAEGSLSSFNSSNLFFLPPCRVPRIYQLNSTISNENYPLGGRWSVREALNLCWLLSALFLLRVYPCPERCLFLNLQPVRSGKPKGPYSIMR